MDSLLKVGGYARSAKLLALVYGSPESSTDSFLDHRPLELGKYAHHLKHCFPARSSRVEALLMQKQINMQRVQLGQEAD